MKLMDEVARFVRAVNVGDAQYQCEKLEAIREWAVHQLPIDYGVGDRVAIIATIPTNDGWAAYREALAVGQTGVVKEIDFSTHSKSWHAVVVLDEAWAVGELVGGDVRRWWKGPARDTPAGMEPPTDYEQKHYPDGKPKSFMFNTSWICKVDVSAIDPDGVTAQPMDGRCEP